MRATIRSKRLAAPVLLVVLISVGCGGGGSTGNRASAGANASASGAAASSATPPGGSNGSVASGQADAALPIASSSDGPSSDTPSSALPAQGQNLPVTATLAHECVVPGSSQTITITTGPNSAVGYHAIYSDGKQGFDKDYYGGNKSGLTDATGNYTDTWVIAPTAPAGKVTVDVVALQQDGASGKTQLSFSMSGAGGCP